MKKLKYECDNCEDIEYWNEILKLGFHCECGGHLHLVKKDHFQKITPYSDCIICINQNTDHCIDCSKKVTL